MLILDLEKKTFDTSLLFYPLGFGALPMPPLGHMYQVAKFGSSTLTDDSQNDFGTISTCKFEKKRWMHALFVPFLPLGGPIPCPPSGPTGTI